MLAEDLHPNYIYGSFFISSLRVQGGGFTITPQDADNYNLALRTIPSWQNKNEHLRGQNRFRVTHAKYIRASELCIVLKAR